MEIMKIPKTKREIDGKIRAHFQFKTNKRKTLRYDNDDVSTILKLLQ